MPLGPPNLASTVLRFSFPVTRRRYAASTTNADGIRVRGAAAETTIRAHLYGATHETLERLAEGHVGARVIEGDTVDDVRTVNEDAQLPADLVRHVDGRWYEVIELVEWRHGPAGAISYRHIVGVEVDRP